jgi:hypothetical protein
MIQLPVPQKRQKLIELGANEELRLFKLNPLTGAFLCASDVKVDLSKYSYFVSTDSKKYGPFDEFKLPPKPPEAPEIFFQYQRGSNWYFRVGEQEYGPFENFLTKYSVRNSSHKIVFAYAARFQHEEFVFLNGQKFGPYRNVFHLALNEAGDRTSWISVQAKQWYSHDMDQVLDQGPYDEPYAWNEGTEPPPSKWSFLEQKDASISVEFFDSLSVPDSPNQIKVNKASWEISLKGHLCRLVLQDREIFLFEYE